MPVKLAAGVAATALFLSVMPAFAHHAFSAEFDVNKPIRLEGTVAKMEWVNPHAWIHIDVKKPDGSTERWIHACGLTRSEEHTSELQSHHDLVCRLLLEKKKKKQKDKSKTEKK